MTFIGAIMYNTLGFQSAEMKRTVCELEACLTLKYQVLSAVKTSFMLVSLMKKKHEVKQLWFAIKLSR